VKQNNTGNKKMKVIRNLSDGKLALNEGRYLINKGDTHPLYEGDETTPGVIKAIMRGWARIEEGGDISDMKMSSPVITSRIAERVWDIEEQTAETPVIPGLEEETVLEADVDPTVETPAPIRPRKPSGAKTKAKISFTEESTVIPED